MKIEIILTERKRLQSVYIDGKEAFNATAGDTGSVCIQSSTGDLSPVNPPVCIKKNY